MKTETESLSYGLGGRVDGAGGIETGRRSIVISQWGFPLEKKYHLTVKVCVCNMERLDREGYMGPLGESRAASIAAAHSQAHTSNYSLVMWRNVIRIPNE